jgi:hypothetical protein
VPSGSVHTIKVSASKRRGFSCDKCRRCQGNFSRGTFCHSDLTLLALICAKTAELWSEDLKVSYFTFGHDCSLVKRLVVHASAQSSASICPLGSDEFVNLSREGQGCVSESNNLRDAP